MAMCVEEYLRRSTEAFRDALAEQLFEVPDSDPEIAGRRAAVMLAAGMRWSSVAGPFTDSAGAAAALGGVSKQAVSQRVAAGSLFGLRLATVGEAPGRLVYPTWQFASDVARHLPKVLAAAGYDPGRPVTGWSIATWLCTGSIGGLSPLERLRLGEVARVCAEAAEVALSLGDDEATVNIVPSGLGEPRGRAL